MSRFKTTDDGVHVNIGEGELETLTNLVEQFRQLLFSGTDPNLTRLEPLACPDDPDAELQYREMAATTLLDHRLNAIDIVQTHLTELGETDEPVVADDSQVAAWMQTLNAMRLYLGERLGVAEHPDGPDAEHPEAPLFAAFVWLGGLLEELVEAAYPALPKNTDG